MMIDVKGTDKAAKPAAAASYERYVLKTEDGRSSTPLYFGVFLTGLALYLKSVFPSWGEEAPANQPAKHPDGEPSGQAPKVIDGQVAAATIETGAPAKSAGAHDESNVIPFQPVTLQDAAALTFFAPPLVEVPLLDFSRVDLRKFGEMSFTVQPANDNGGAVSSFSVDQGGGAEPAADRAEDKEGKHANKAPRTSGPVRLADMYSINAALFGLSDLLGNASDPDGDALRVENVTVSSGELVQIPGGWAYVAAAIGPVTISYQISDGTTSISQTAVLSVLQAPPIRGTDKADELAGSKFADEINGGGGADKIEARGGDDVIAAADGDDQIAGGDGDDIIRAGNGNDMVLGGSGNDQIWGGDGDDRLAGEAGRDTIFGDAGDDTIQGGRDDDALFGGTGRDGVYGDAGNDALHGDDGNDLLQGGAGGDVVEGGGDNDRIIGDADHADDDYDGGTGEDVLDYAAIGSALNIDTATGSASGSEIGRDKIARFETVRAGSGGDTIAGSARNERLEGNGGNDSIAGNAGDDDLIGGAGEDNIQGGAGSDLIHGDAGNDCLSGDEGSDIIYGDAGDDVVRGDRDQANDIYNGGVGVDTLDYSAAMMTVAISLTDGKAAGAEIGQDSVAGFEIVKGGRGNDTLIGGTDNDLFWDGEGRDQVSGGSGDDHVVASDDGADDFYNGGEGTDTLDYSHVATGILIDLRTGQATGLEIGTDQIGGFEVAVGGSGNDSFLVGTSGAVLKGGAGQDDFEFQLPQSGAADLMHQIVDFMVGDRISLSNYQLFEEVVDTLDDQFEQIYGEQNASANALPIRILHERTDQMEQTLIQIDMDRDDHYEMTINLSGHHVLMTVETA